jgi:hypothetical protein
MLAIGGSFLKTNWQSHSQVVSTFHLKTFKNSFENWCLRFNFMVCQILHNLLNKKQVHYVNTIISWWEQVCGIKKKGSKNLLKIQITLICLIYLWWLTFDLVVEKERVVNNNYNYKLYVFFFFWQQ